MGLMLSNPRNPPPKRFQIRAAIDDEKPDCGEGVDDIAGNLADRLINIWLPGPDGRRPVYGGVERFQTDPAWKDNLLFFEYFHGDNGAGLGAMHQTGWTALVVDLLLDPPRRSRRMTFHD
jgi:hypothetical protein